MPEYSPVKIDLQLPHLRTLIKACGLYEHTITFNMYSMGIVVYKECLSQFSVAPMLGSLERRCYKSAHGKTHVGKKTIQRLECYSKAIRYMYLRVA